MNADDPPDAKLKDGPRHETRAGRAPAKHESEVDDVHPMVLPLPTQTCPAAVIIAPQNCFTDFRPVAFVTSALPDANRQTNAVLIRDEREMNPCFDDAQDFRARFSKIHKR